MSAIALVTDAAHASLATQEPDDRRLLAALTALGEQVESVPWNDPEVEWSAYDLVVVRSTWDYPRDRDAFLAWAHTVSHVSALWNPVPMLVWNTEKHYLRVLEACGVPCIPTVWLEAGQFIDLADTLDRVHWQHAVIKPVVGTNALGVALLDRTEITTGQQTLCALLQKGSVLLQEYYPSIHHAGEHSLVFIDGQFTHAFRKGAFGCLGEEVAMQPTPEEVSLAHQVLATAWHCLGEERAPAFLFARVDLVQDAGGKPRVMELELTEPRLRLDFSPDALALFVEAIRARLCTRSLVR